MRPWSPCLLLSLLLAACTVGERGSRRPRATPLPGDPPSPAARDLPPPLVQGPRADDPGVIPGTPSLRVVWEALAVEHEQLRSSRFRPTGQNVFGEPDLEVILLNASFVPTPEQDRENRSQTAVGRVARTTDRDMIDLVREFERIGFFRYAHPTESVRPYFGSDRARGRVTVERDGESVTLVSYRGLGLQEATKAIPGIYAQAKAAIQVLKNRSPAMSVKGARLEPVRPPTPSAGSGGAGAAMGAK